jgi:hypothetical protein
MELNIGIGTALTRSIFYNTETDVLSSWFYDPIASDGSVVAYISLLSTGEFAIIIQSIFSEDIIATFVRDFSPVAK